jgi:D-alanyl-D-alanine dipeptidase
VRFPAVAAFSIASVLPLHPAAAEGLPAGFVYLRDIDPSIAQDIRYAGPENFTEQALPGYDATECVLREPGARALAAVQADLAAQGLGLKVYDCYRPARAVQAMVEWASADKSDVTDQRFFPNVPKGALVAQGYIAAHSTHSTGLAVDVTLVARNTSRSTPPPSGPCRGPADDSLDMGTTYDCFDPVSHTSAQAIGAEARQHRALLVAAMQRHGFVNYHREWWHFSYSRTGSASGTFDFPIVARSAR